MIWQLAREQLRSQKRYLAWTGGMLIAVIALATFSTVMGATEQQANRQINALTGESKSHHGFAESSLVANGDAAVADDEGTASIASVAEVDAAIESAAAQGSDLIASRYTSMYAVDPLDYTSVVIAVSGDVDWERILVEGDAPAAGQIALSGRIAEQIGKGVGETVELVGDYVSVEDGGEGESAAIRTELTISGITRTPLTGDDLGATMPEAYASWEDSVALAIMGSPWLAEDEGSVLTTDVSWSTGSPDPAIFEEHLDYEDWNGDLSAFESRFETYLAIALTLGLIILSIAIGRNQAHARVTWVGTARAMGARRSTIAAATMLETVIIGLGASIIGIVVGYAGAFGYQALLRGSVPYPLYPTSPVLPVTAIAALVGFGVLLAALIGAMPAFWASRIEPVDALKAKGTLPERRASARTQKVVLYAWIISLVALTALTFWGVPEDSSGVLGSVVGLAAFALTCAVAYRVLRATIAAVGARLDGSSRPWAIGAGQAMSARAGQSAIPSLIFAVMLAPMAAWTIFLLQPYAAEDSESAGFAQVFWAAGFMALLVGAAIASVVSLAVFSSDSRATRADGATRAALGMTVGDERKARFVHYALSLSTGVVLGLVVGTALSVALVAIGAASDPSAPPYFTGSGSLVPAGIGFALIFLFMVLFIAGGAAAYASRAPKASPVEELTYA